MRQHGLAATGAGLRLACLELIVTPALAGTGVGVFSLGHSHDYRLGSTNLAVVCEREIALRLVKPHKVATCRLGCQWARAVLAFPSPASLSHEMPHQATISAINYDLEAHRQALVDLLASYAGDATSGAGRTLTDFARREVAQGLRQHPTSLVLLAWCDAKPAGLAICFEGYSTFAAKPLINIHDLVVAPELRGQGVGTCLLQAVEGEARRRGCCAVTLEVNGHNIGAQRLYRRQGYLLGQSIAPAQAMMFGRKLLDSQ